MLKRRGYSLFRILIISLVVISVVIYKFGENIKNFFSQHGADVASKSLESKNLKMSAEQLSKDVVQQVLSDPKTVEQAVNFLSQLFARKDTQDLLVALLLQVLKDPTTQTYVSKFVKEIVAMYLLHDEQTMQVTADFVYRILQKPETKDQLVILLNNALQDESFRQSVAEMFSAVILYDVVKKSGAELGSDAVHTVLEDQNVKQHAESFITAVLLNQKIQHDAGFALWEALKVSLTPTWFYHPPKTEQQGAEQGATATNGQQAENTTSDAQNKDQQKEPAVTESANSVANPALEQEQISQAAQTPAVLEQNGSSLSSTMTLPSQDVLNLSNDSSSSSNKNASTSSTVSNLSIQESPPLKDSIKVATPPQTSSKPTTSTEVVLVSDNNNKP
ncbi:hypothetical protein FDP41_006959 [Naegleria fowleri]|uniref:Uncharacterized protein n=1 Tax=Naegleria fowleri TaxID=5763 RepID=A0A6A5BJ01_NAEFO|nr:uncharacterized protein FDP41_006959 [Naegleria fowleri]KAF0974028.1 hypothetical protein FDP41_006959 [Naegleria fowleri]